LGCLIMSSGYWSLFGLPARVRGVFLVMLVGGVLGVVVFVNGYGCGRAGGEFTVEVGFEVESSEVISPSECGGLFAGEWEYEEVDWDELAGLLRGGDDGDEGEEAKEGERVLRRRSYDSASERWRSVLDTKRHEMIGLDGEGNLVLYETIDESHDARMVYGPALILIYANQEAGKVYRQETKATIWSVKHPKRKDDHGRVEREIVYEGDEPIETLATGMVNSHRVHVVQHMDFKRADVDIDSTTWYVDGFGQVGMVDTEKVRVFGLIGWDEHTGLRLVGLNRSVPSDGSSEN